MDGRTWVASESISVISPEQKKLGTVVVAVLFVALTRTYSGARKGSGRDKGGSATYDDGCGHSDSEIRQSRGTTEKTAHKRPRLLSL